MIKKDFYKSREDGVTLFRIYSDTDHKIKKIGTEDIYDDVIDVEGANFEYEEIDEYVDIEGAESYDEVISLQEQLTNVTRKINRIGLTDKEALSVKEFYPHWEDFIGKTIEQGFIVYCDNLLYKARQTHTAQSDWYPSLSTASLYEVIEVEHEGTEADPIPYNPPMEIFKDKYYIEDEVLYKCTRDSGTALSHYLFSLVGLYVEVV